MKLSHSIKDTRLHRFYRVIWWGLIIVSIPVAVYSTWSHPRLIQNMRAAEADAVAKHYSEQVIVWTRNDFLHRIEQVNTMFFVALLIFVLALLLPILYRLLLYILYGTAAFHRHQRAASHLKEI
jgi:hypothetical protein